MNASASPNRHLAEAPALRPVQLAWLAAAVFVVSAGYGALMPVLPGWLGSLMPDASAPEVARHVGFFSGVYAAGVLVGAPLWGAISDRVGRSRILIIGLIGYIASQLLLLVPGLESLWGLYGLRAATGLFVAAVVPVVSALVAEHTPEDKRARRFAWLSAMSLLGFLFGPGLNEVADAARSWAGAGVVTAATSARAVIVLSALLGAVMMLGLARTLPASRGPDPAAPKDPTTPAEVRTAALCWFSGIVMLVLAGFELGIVLQGQQHAEMSPRQVATMGALAAAAGLGQTLGSSLGGWLFGSLAQVGFGLLIVPLAAMLALLFARPGWWSVIPAASTSRSNGLPAKGY